ncbi:hypothetical protein BD626DRAFT_568843 [Schizophyllum amplum]|uniref:Uncharacterized protein n=1 Tax=Schizophyllum amplum TaxID=97359 RepID=A0A550CF62_9AGAR|nr:hypothetical protein BD626DRAFT_568843 [Auriculariopsis ampla]
MSVVPSTAISTHRNVEECPVVNHRIVSFDEGHYRRQIEHFEYYWGSQKGDLNLNSPLNHIELRSDMVDRLLKREWILMPRKKTLQAMQQMAEYNKTADVGSRRNYLREFPDDEHEYDMVPLWMLKRDCPTLYVNRKTGVKAFPAPYTRFPRVKSRAHPFFVAFWANRQLNRCAALIYPDKKATMLMWSVGGITACWMKEPPPAFLVGPDVWMEHHHPLSDDGHAARSALQDSRADDTTDGGVRKTTRAPCRQPKSTARPTPYAKCDLRPARARGSVLPRPGIESGKKDNVGYGLSDLRMWIGGVGLGDCTSIWESTWLDDEAIRDEELARYRQEVWRDAEDALHPQTTMNGGGLILGHGVDRSGYSSNNWAMRTYHVCLWAVDPWVHIKVRPL